MNHKFDEKIQNMSFEQALSELETIVKKLETGSENLENAIELYEYGDLLRKFCENKLKDAQLKIEKISRDESGNIKTESVNID